MASEEIFSLPETHFFSKLPDSDKLTKKPKYLRARKKLSRILEKANFSNHPSYFFKRRSAFEAFFNVLDAEAELRGFRGWMEKTPRHLYNVDEIFESEKDTLFVFTTRNIHDNVSSFLKVSPQWYRSKQKQTTGYAASRWAADNAMIAALSMKVSGHIFDYDNAISNPHQEISRLYNYLGLKNPATALEKDLSIYKKQITEEKETWKSNNNNPSIKPYGKNLSEEDEKIIKTVQNQLDQKSRYPN